MGRVVVGQLLCFPSNTRNPAVMLFCVTTESVSLSWCSWDCCQSPPTSTAFGVSSRWRLCYAHWLLLRGQQQPLQATCGITGVSLKPQLWTWLTQRTDQERWMEIKKAGRQNAIIYKNTLIWVLNVLAINVPGFSHCLTWRFKGWKQWTQHQKYFSRKDRLSLMCILIHDRISDISFICFH